MSAHHQGRRVSSAGRFVAGWRASWCLFRWPAVGARRRWRRSQLPRRLHRPTRSTSRSCCSSVRHLSGAAPFPRLSTRVGRRRFGSGHPLERSVTQKLLRSRQQHNGGRAGSISSASRGPATMRRSKGSSTSIRCRFPRSVTTRATSLLDSVSPRSRRWWCSSRTAIRRCSWELLTKRIFKPSSHRRPPAEWPGFE